MNYLEMLAKIKSLKAEAKKDGITAEQINEYCNQIEALEAQARLAKIEEDDARNTAISSAKPVNTSELSKEQMYKNAFYNVLKGKTLTEAQSETLAEFNNALSSTTGADGGYLIPVDQVTAIRELQRQMKDASTLVTVEPVGTLTGSRNIEKDAEHTPFVTFAEGDDVPTSDAPQFVNIPYNIKDYGGILPIPNNLLADNSANLESYLNMWIAKKDVATKNKLIFDLLATQAKTAIASCDDLKKALNVTLDPAIAAMSVVVTNQTGWNWLDTLKDKQDRYLLQPMPGDPTRKALFGIYPVEMYSDKILKNDATKAPIIIGSLKEAVTLFDRQAMSLLSTNVGGDAFVKNRTNIRAILRLDVEKFDTSAFVYGQVTVTA